MALQLHGDSAARLTYRRSDGAVEETILYGDRDTELTVGAAADSRGFDADPELFRLAAEAVRIRMAARSDAMLAVSTSLLDPLPHQIQAVYNELLPRTPLRFLLADDPGAGKTIMAGLYIKELALRGDLERCLIVAPGGLVEQWQDELLEKFGLDFALLSKQLVDATVDANVFDKHPRLIARMDALSRSEELQRRLTESSWDLVVVDEAHRMSAHYFGAELKTTKRYELGRLLGRVTRNAASTDRRSFLSALRRELPDALKPLRQSSIPAVDLAQAAIGPGMAIFSRYAKVTESDGTPMRVRTALSMINEVLGEVLSEQEGDFDTDTRWCLKWFEQRQWEQGPFGEAELLANALNTSLSGLEDVGVVKARANQAELLKPEAMPASYDPETDHRSSVWEATMHLSRVLDGKGAGSGIDAAGELLARARTRVDDDAMKELTYLLYSICERNGWSESGRRFNNLVSSWPDLQIAGRAAEKRGGAASPSQLSFRSSNDDEEDQLF
ncbi:DEAD/DEAH box helicase family protein [Streptomyces sp. NBC_01190]|uniref:DEAD/DEAH box helicase family protein n=1 Tax=Streptomyces sp. NBC_01190 TaxID=2903767 RepID=UPI0038663DF2|nr:DEAD/DEAH box helicase family protein [Streptomyces sp. NBC_01190]